jgi:hypothetical protein
MTTQDRNRLRKLQDRFLLMPTVKQQIESEGEYAVAFDSRPRPVTYKHIKELLYPELEGDIKEILREYSKS